MFEITMKTVAIPTDKWLLGLCALLSWTVLLAQGIDELDLSPKYDELFSDEIFENADDWRNSPKVENPWRTPQKRKAGGARFGYDPSYEEMQAKQPRFRDPTPSSLIRLQF